MPSWSWTRAGRAAPGRTGDTSDTAPEGAGPQYPGFLTRGITSPATYYYRRVFTDAVRAVEAAREHPLVDGRRIIASGGSQGGGIALAVAGLATGIAAACIDVPFLCHYRRAIELTDEDPYAELRRYLATHRGSVESTFRTLSYFDGLSFASRATAPAIFSVALMDQICPPSTVYARLQSLWREGADPRLAVQRP